MRRKSVRTPISARHFESFRKPIGCLVALRSGIDAQILHTDFDLLFCDSCRRNAGILTQCSTGWFTYSRVFIAPASGAEPVRRDPAHPLISNDEYRESGKQPSFP
jgi:hypothetical protein